MFNRFFKPKWQHTDVLVRLKAVEDLNEKSDFDSLRQIIAQDVDSRVRHAALVKIQQPALLEGFLSQAEKIEDWMMVATHIYEVAPALRDRVIVGFHQTKEHWEQNHLVCQLTHCEHVELLVSILKSSQDNDLLLAVACQAKPVQIRIWAVEHVQSLAILQQIIKQANHKQVIQIARQKLKQIKAKEAELAETNETAERLCRAMKKLATQEWEASYQSQLDNIEKKWLQLDQDLIQEWFIAYDKHLGKCQQIIACHKQDILEQERLKQFENEQNKLIDEVVKLVRQLEQESLSTHTTVKDALTLVEKNWKQLLAETPVNTKLKGKYEGAVAKLNQYLTTWDEFEKRIPDFFDLFEGAELTGYVALKQWKSGWYQQIKLLAWPKYLATPKLLLDWQNQARARLAEIKQIQQEQQKLSSYLAGKIKLLQKHIRDKNLIAANKLMNYLDFKKRPLIEEFLSDIEGKIQKVEIDLSELRDWHAFATRPKKTDLCQKMESLANDELEPLQLAKKVRDLQEQWHELIASDATADNDMWERFKLAADKAYRPCIEYYNEQDKVKLDNLNKRIEVCESLEALYNQTDWQHANWKKIDKLQQSAIKNWRRYAPVPNNEHQSAQNRFDKVNQSIREMLNSEKQRNLELRQDLVAKAERLEGVDELVKAIDSAKKLQQDWKSVGVTFYKADKEQWSLFRKALDRVFAKRDEEKQVFQNTLKANQLKIEEITSAIKSLIQLDDLELKNSFEKFDGLRQSWNKTLELPRSQANQLTRQFQNACDDYLNHFNGLKKRLLQQNFMNIREFEQRVVSFELSNDCEDLSDLQQAIENSRLQDRIKVVFSDRLKDNSTDNSIQKLQDLVLKAEIQVGSESPKEFKQQRMAMQLEQLQQGAVTQYSASQQQELVVDIYNHWLSIKVTSLDAYQPLQKRLDKVLKLVGLIAQD